MISNYYLFEIKIDRGHDVIHTKRIGSISIAKSTDKKTGKPLLYQSI